MSISRSALSLVSCSAFCGVLAAAACSSDKSGASSDPDAAIPPATAGTSGTAGKTGGAGSPGAAGKTGAAGAPGAAGMTGAAGSTAGSSGGAGAPGTPDGGAAVADAKPVAADTAVAPTTDAAPGVSPKMSFFITSRKGGGNLGGLDGADAICKTLATAVGVGNKTWRAYLSTDAPKVDAGTRIGKGPWFNAKGEMIAMNLQDLHDGAPPKNNLKGSTALDEKGNAVPGRVGRPAGTELEHDILTGTQMDGTVATGMTCGDWKDETKKARIGHFDRDGGGGTVPLSDKTAWNSSHDNQGCSPTTVLPGGGAGRFYCFAAE